MKQQSKGQTAHKENRKKEIESGLEKCESGRDKKKTSGGVTKPSRQAPAHASRSPGKRNSLV